MRASERVEDQVEQSANDGLRLRSVCELLDEKFLVPDYQRGYRWGPQQVTALLDDLAAFEQSNHDQRGYYCLQPVVVRARDGGVWEVVDGQQRLTTILLILRAQADVAALLRRRPYSISYETRPGSERFLEAPSAEQATENIDFHYMWEAYRTIQSWFDSRDGALRFDILNFLTRPDSPEKANVRVIWYPLAPTENATATFLRLNAGRIPLTSSELIRALLLRSEQSTLEEHERQQVAQDWDLLERRLQDDAYWYFLQSSTVTPATRIEYLFDLWVSLHSEVDPAVAREDPLATFFHFQRVLDNGKHEDIWRDFKRMAEVLEEWFEHPKLFHLVGYLVATAPGVARTSADLRRAGAEVLRGLLGARRTRTATAFDRHLRWLAWHRFLGTTKLPASESGLTVEALQASCDERLKELGYRSSGQDVRRALLLFNIAEVLEMVDARQDRARKRLDSDPAGADAFRAEDPGANPRFQFARFWEESWDIEHVRSVAENKPNQVKGQRIWLTQARSFVGGPAMPPQHLSKIPALIDDIDDLLTQGTPEAKKFDGVFATVREISGEPDARDDDHAISNLVLLDMTTNRSYRNAIFPVKRERIIGLDKEGTYLPPATRNVFLKYYTPNASQLLLWDQEDQKKYGDAITKALHRFFSPLAEGAAYP